MKNIIVLDNFYSDPEAVRELALSCEWIEKEELPEAFPGSESKVSFFNDDIVQKIEKALGQKIEVDPVGSSFGVFAKASNEDQGKNPVHRTLAQRALFDMGQQADLPIAQRDLYLKTLLTTNAEYSPRLCPARSYGVRSDTCCHARQSAVLAVNSTGCVISV